MVDLTPKDTKMQIEKVLGELEQRVERIETKVFGTAIGFLPDGWVQEEHEHEDEPKCQETEVKIKVEVTQGECK